MQIPCPTCRKRLDQKTTRKAKPYFVCEACGVQVFIRFQEGIERLKTGLGDHILGNGDYALCEKCGIAVRVIPRNVQRRIFTAPGIYCPKCDALLAGAKHVVEKK